MTPQTLETSIAALVEQFTRQITTVLEGSIQDALGSIFTGPDGIAPKRGPGRPRTIPQPSALLLGMTSPEKPRKKRPKQICPVPGCKNVAAPIFGMVCSDHKDLAKSVIKKYRETRKQERTGKVAKKKG